MIRTACIAATLLASTLVPAACASAAVTLNGKISQIINALRNSSDFSQGDFTFGINGPGGTRTLFKGIQGVRAFSDYQALNSWVDDQAGRSVFDGAPYKFTHSVLDSYFDDAPKSSLFDGSPYKFTHSVLGSYFGDSQSDDDTSVEQRMMIAAPLDPDYVAQTLDQPVPEPASWAMMIGGFALIGAVMRRRGTAVRAA